MTIGKPLRCYPFKKKDWSFMYLPYDKTEFDLTFVGDNTEIKTIKEYWEAIGKPKYDPRKSITENLTDLKNYIGYWPEPLLNDKIVQTTLLEYEDDETKDAVQDYFKMQQDFQLKQEQPKTKKVYRKKDWDEDDDVPF